MTTDSTSERHPQNIKGGNFTDVSNSATQGVQDGEAPRGREEEEGPKPALLHLSTTLVYVLGACGLRAILGGQVGADPVR